MTILRKFSYDVPGWQPMPSGPEYESCPFLSWEDLWDLEDESAVLIAGSSPKVLPGWGANGDAAFLLRSDVWLQLVGRVCVQSV